LKGVPFLPNSFRLKVVEEERQETIDEFIAVFHQSNHFLRPGPDGAFDFKSSSAKNDFAETMLNSMACHVIEHVQVEHFFFLDAVVIS